MKEAMKSMASRYLAKLDAEPESPEEFHARTGASMRKFESGATRNQDSTEPDYEGFMSPLSVHRFGQYMNRHRVQADGSVRESDNWQKGIPRESYMKSLWRHTLDAWLHHRGHRQLAREGLEEALCGVIFNASGMLHEVVKRRLQDGDPED